jgi:NADPH:quinone reductase
MQSYWMQVSDAGAVIERRDVPRPEPGPAQVLVRMQAAALNRGEFIAGHGLHSKPGAKRIGMEGAGEIAALGAGVSDLKIGDRVMGRCAGAFSEYALMDLRDVHSVPKNISDEEAAVIPVVYDLAYDLLVLHGKIGANEWVLVNGVSSGVGVASLQLAKALGAKVIGTSGSSAKLARLRELGLDVPICTRKPDFHDAAMQATGGAGVQIVINTVGGTVFAEEIRCMGFQARLGMVGYVDGVLNAQIDLEALHAKRLILFGASNKMRTPEQRAASGPGFRKDVLPLLAEGRIKPVVDRVFPFEQLEQARDHMQADRHLGKIVLAMPGSKGAAA